MTAQRQMVMAARKPHPAVEKAFPLAVQRALAEDGPIELPRTHQARDEIIRLLSRGEWNGAHAVRVQREYGLTPGTVVELTGEARHFIRRACDLYGEDFRAMVLGGFAAAIEACRANGDREWEFKNLEALAKIGGLFPQQSAGTNVSINVQTMTDEELDRRYRELEAKTITVAASPEPKTEPEPEEPEK